MFAVAGVAEENVRQVTDVVLDLFVTFAVRVTFGFKIYVPVPAFVTSTQVAFAVIVIVCPVAATAVSAAVGDTPPTHVAPTLKLPDAEDVIVAMA
jgi:hypothetical protein